MAFAVRESPDGHLRWGCHQGSDLMDQNFPAVNGRRQLARFRGVGDADSNWFGPRLCNFLRHRRGVGSGNDAQPSWQMLHVYEMPIGLASDGDQWLVKAFLLLRRELRGELHQDARVQEWPELLERAEPSRDAHIAGW